LAFKIKEYEQFQLDCNSKRCNRQTTYNTKTCIKEFKQKDCYRKYLIKVEKDNAKFLNKKNVDKNYKDLNNVDTEYEEFKRKVWLRDYGSYDGVSTKQNWMDVCVFWNSILTVEEKKYILKNDSQNLWVNKNIDIVHIESVGRKPEEKHNIDNALLGGRLFHGRLDQFKDPVFNTDMTNEQRNIWLNRMKNYIKEIKKYEIQG
jgi:hypothetical protein